jgi:hypothetical protein
MNTPYTYAAGMAGIQTAAIIFGGQYPPITTTQLYYGTAWTTSPATLNVSRRNVYGTGTQTAALASGGATIPGPTYSGSTESYNGSAWTSLNNMNTARYGAATSQSGTQTATIAFGGFSAPPPGTASSQTESWNGTSWTVVNSLPSASGFYGSAGNQTAALAFNGSSNTGSPGSLNTTLSWNGTSWTTNHATTRLTRYGSGGAGTQTSALSIGGSTDPETGTTATEAWNGTSWSNYPNMANARGATQISSAGTQTAALAAGASAAATEEWTGEVATANSKTLTTS